MTTRVFVPGRPRGKARPRVTKTGHAYTPESTRAYEERVHECWLAQGGTYYGERPLEMTITAYVHIPMSASQKARAEMIAERYCRRKPDLDNLAKICMDALQDHGKGRRAYKDDLQIVRLTTAREWVEDPGAEGVEITIEDIEDIGEDERHDAVL